MKKVSDCIAEGVYPVYAAIDNNGSRILRSNSVKRDKSGNYWLIGENATVFNIYEVPIRNRLVNHVRTWQFQSDKADANGRVRKQWINFGDVDEYGKTCKIANGRTDAGEYSTSLDDTFCVNFRFTDD